MRVNFYATLRALVGGKTVEVPLAVGTSACVVLEAVTNPRPDLAAEIWQAPGQVKDHIHVFINGRQSIFLPQGLQTPLEKDATLDVFPPVGGGT